MLKLRRVHFFEEPSAVRLYPSLDAMHKNHFELVTPHKISELFKAHRGIPEFLWTNNPIVPDSLTTDIILEGALIDSIINLNALALCWIEGQGFVAVSIRPIKKEQWLFFNGVPKPLMDDVDSNPYVFSKLTDNHNHPWAIDANTIGGFSSLMKTMKDKVHHAHPLFNAQQVSVNGFPQCILKAKEDISEFQRLMFI